MRFGSQTTSHVRAAEPLGGEPRPACPPLARGPDRTQPLAGGEDDIFRDPFGDFAPSGR